MKHVKNMGRLEKSRRIASPQIRGKLTGNGSNGYMALEKELKYFRENHDKWKKANLGKFALVKGDSFVEFFDTSDNALSAGLTKFGAEPFLIRQIVEVDVPIQIPALTLGLLNARLA